MVPSPQLRRRAWLELMGMVMFRERMRSDTFFNFFISHTLVIWDIIFWSTILSLSWWGVVSVFTAHTYPSSEFPEENRTVMRSQWNEIREWGPRITYAGHPRPIETHARIVSPLPYPNRSYMMGANKGKPNPASDRKNETAARAKIRVDLWFQPYVINWDVKDTTHLMQRVAWMNQRHTFE